MKKQLLTMGLALAVAMPLSVNAADYVIDTKGAHASINFNASHLGYSFIKGRFNKFSGDFSYDANDIGSSKVNVFIDTTSIDTNHAERDKHLRSADFIDAGKYPDAKFVSTKITDKGNGNIDVAGDLTLYGKTKPVVIDAKFIGEGKDPWGGYRVGFVGTTTLQLKDFGMKAMGAISSVDMELIIEGVRK
ncbi:YceI family protein [Vibrio sp. SCSIO 43137]|uniref:YceI family protein n=1 Tax=Vibrio sp. SCSIO 43137 TaxID=3021011 RepID=UPI002307B981|nr:YceI family protein [Vibrio sp. SCSIO 43137]WCE31335.1 YceI family protein [Vibrio sp. SCSIO 43137]